MLISFSAARPLAAAADVLALVVPQGKVAAALADLDGADGFGGALAAAAKDDGFDGRAGTSFWSPGLGKIAAKRLVLLGVGNGSTNELRAAAGSLGKDVRNKGAKVVAIASAETNVAPALSLMIEAYAEGNYRFDKYKPVAQRKAPTDTLTFIGVAEDPRAVAHALALAAGQELARNLVNEPAAEIHPDSIAAVAEGLAGGEVSVVASWDYATIQAKKMGGIVGVGQGSDKKPRFVHLRYEPAGGAPKAHVALVGKGVTFDSGGLSLKPSDGMLTMRCDMGGAAAVIGAMKAIAAIKPNVRVDMIFGAVENMPSGNSYKLGDILTMYSGKKVEIHNTDAEGRLVLADCLHYASELKPDAVVDLATLTGAAVVALGDWYSALYSREESVSAGLLSAAETSGEAAWRMPLADIYRDKIKAEWGETKNTGGRNAGSITAALFLSDFVTTPKWAHVDIAGPAFLDSPLLHYVQGGTGIMVRTLTRWVEGLGQ